ncbi:MAG: flagellar basal body-associated FliL family protein [Zoogloeaceae bacterium]|jgi:flagellar FliL protein|nr:flagellar basal body-associated FliL family protein [Zoogloeaceae bacterium]
MAKESVAEAKPRNTLKLLVVFLVIALFVVVIGAAVMVFLFSGNHGGGNGDEDEEEVAQEEERTEKRKRDPGAPPVFSELDDFIVNLLPDPPPAARQLPAPVSGEGEAILVAPQPVETPYIEENHFLQVKIVLELDEVEADARIKTQMPRIRNNLTTLLSNKTAKSLATKAGKEALAEEIMNEINDILVPPVKGKKQSGPVVSVLFNAFLIQ